jgi:hypothetical protein
MIPEAFEEGGSKIGLAAMAGFVIAFVLGRIGIVGGGGGGGCVHRICIKR